LGFTSFNHYVYHCLKLAPTLGKDKVIICNFSGRGDKDVMQVAKIKGVVEKYRAK